MATTRRFRPNDDWMATRISTRPSPPKEPRDERVRIPRPLGGNNNGVKRPTPLDLKLAQAKGSVKLVRPDGEVLREPEIVDLDITVPRTRPARRDGCPPYPPPPPPKSNRMPRGPPSVASTRQSEMSFGVLDYYINDPSPVHSPALPIDATQKVDSAIDKFDFGLEDGRGQAGDAKSGAEDEMELIPLSPRPFEDDNKPELPAKTKYSLFPAVKEVTPSANRLAQVINDSPVESHHSHEGAPYRQQGSALRPRLLSGAKLASTPFATRQRADTVPSSTEATTSPTPQTAIPSPSYHPRNPSLSFSNTSRLPSASISSGSTNTNSSRRIPLRILSSSSTATTSTMNTTSRSSISTSPGSTIVAQQKPLLSRWSEDTALASPTTAAAVLGCRTSFGSLLGGDLGNGEGYPACFFEDDEEEVPLRRKRTRSGKIWRRWLCCGGKG